MCPVGLPVFVSWRPLFWFPTGRITRFHWESNRSVVQRRRCVSLLHKTKNEVTVVGTSELIALKTAPIGNLVIIDRLLACLLHQNEKSRHLDSNAVTLQNSR